MREPLKFRSAEEKALWVQAFAAAQAHGALHRADRIADNALISYRKREQEDISARLVALKQVVKDEAVCVFDWSESLSDQPHLKHHLSLIAERLRAALKIA